MQGCVPFEHAALPFIKVKSSFSEEQVQTFHFSNLDSPSVFTPGKVALDTVGFNLN